MMATTQLTRSLKNVWTDNAALVHLLGLCPLLAITNTVANALVMGMATLLVVSFSNVLVSLFRNMIPHEVRLPVFVVIIGALVGVIDLLIETFFYVAHQTIGLFIPLIVTNCVIIARAEVFASKNGVAAAALDGLLTGVGFLITLLALGALREAIGSGALFGGLGLFFGSAADTLRVSLPGYPGFIPALLPAGAFFVCALLISVHKALQKNREQSYSP